MKFAGMEYTESSILLDSIERSEFQPTDRDNMGRGKRQALIASIEKHGLKDPIDVIETETGYEVVEGHGRVQAMRLLNQARISARVFKCKNKEEAALLRLAFYEVNNTQLKMSGAEWLEFYIRAKENGADLGGLIRLPAVVSFLELNFKKPADIHAMVYGKGIGPDDLSVAKRGARLILGWGRGDRVPDDNETLINVFKWVVKHGQTFPLRRFIENGGGAKKLAAIIDADKPL